ncbi:hypothetical protein [Nonomuraea sp. NPDC049504]|uniref:hypothetical protein n=1 Tax=Nonomuraea sp. NPDC049504 TaxID=3154729 RepID=UPI003431A7AF
MTDYWVGTLKDSREPQIDGTQPLGGDAESSDGISDLIQSTKPEKVAEAGRRYTEIAEMCATSVELLHTEAARIAQTLGGESLEGIFGTIGELQRDLARLSFAARSVGQPLVWYGAEVLPWFHHNVPRTGSVDLDDSLGDAVGTDTNAHALARHHLQQLNRFIQAVYHSIDDHVEQRTTAPQTSLTDPSFDPRLGLPSGLTANPYGNLGSTPGFDGPGLPGSGGPDLPRLDDPSLQDPSLRDPSAPDPSAQDPSLQDPSLQNPSLQNPSLQNPSLQNPSLQNPSLQDPSLRNPSLENPSLHQPDLRNPATHLSSYPNPQVPTTQSIVPGMPTGAGPSMLPGSAAATQLGGTPGGPGAPGAGGMPGGPMGMIPPMGGAGGAGQERERERMKMPLTEHDPFDSDDLGGPPLIT